MNGLHRVIAYTMHEHEQAAALAKLQGAEPTDSFVIGDADQATIQELRDHGLIVRELPPAAVGGAPNMRGPRLARPRVGSFVALRVNEPLTESHLYELSAAGLEPRERLDSQTFLSEVMVPEGVEAALQMSFVGSVVPYQAPLQRNPSRILKRGPALAGTPLTYDVLAHDATRLDEIEAFARTKGITEIARSRRKLRVRATPQQADDLNAHDAVSTVEEFVPPKLYNDRAQAIVWPQRVAAAPPLTGAGELVAVADSGLDDKHEAFANKAVVVIARGRPNDASDPHGHGTHVAGTIAGDGAHQRGIAPGAKLLFQSVMDPNGGLGGLGIDLEDLFSEAYQANARIHNNSWGADLAATYTVSSLEVDGFVHEHKDMLIVVAAGNAGSCHPVGMNPTQVPRGSIEWGSIGAPATSKNALVVGASRSDRTAGGTAEEEYGTLWPQEFEPPIGKERVSGDPESMAAFSSRGPCNDRRIKPDVVAPGTDILSAAASTASKTHFNGFDYGSKYGYMNGTSMAAPLVAGFAALVREWLRTQRQWAEPSAALMKAVIINGTRHLGDPLVQHAPPNFDQGFGLVHMPTTLPLDGSFVLEFVDNWKTPAEHFTRTGMRRRFEFTTTTPGPVRITMAYTDAPGRGAQNDLSLIVELPDKTKRIANEKIPLQVFLPDPDNNVESLRIDHAPAGKYIVQVMASTILKPPQDFALVVTGSLAQGSFHQI